jgi:PAS domain S-box-containing protein
MARPKTLEGPWTALRLSAPELSRSKRYAGAVSLVVLGGLLQNALLPYPSATSFLFFYLTVTLASWLGGRGPGLVATVLSAISANFFFTAPRYALSLSGPVGRATFAFLPVAGLVAILVGSLRTSMLQARAAIRAQRRASQALEASEARLRLAKDAARLGIYDHDLRTGRIEWDDRLREIWGLAETPAGWDQIQATIHPDDRDRLRSALAQADSSNSDYVVEYRIRRPRDGRERWIQATGHVSVEGDRPVRHVGTTEDITERKHAEAELRLLGEIAANVGEGVYLVSVKDLTIQYANPTMERMFGYEPGELVGRHVSTINAVADGDPVQLASRIEAALREHGRYRGDVLTVKKDGTPFWSRATISMMHHPPYGDVYVSLQADISERKRAEEALRQADRRKSEFLGVLSHELRNPLAPIRTSAYLLGRSGALNERDRRAIATIDRQVSHLARLIDDLLDVTRIERGKINLQRSNFDLVEVVRRVVEDHRSAFESREVEVALADEPLWIDGDATRIAQVVTNLASNAAKFTPAGGRISLSLHRADSRLAVLEVADTGVGIDADTLAHLFEPFAQADRSLDRSRGGLGLGLALVKGLVELHGGEVAAQSRGPGAGARFTVKLPLTMRQDRVKEGEAAVGGLGGQGKKVLIIEDNVDSATSLGEVLALEGARVAVTHNGTEGIARAHEFTPDVVLCDIGLPGIDGYDVARALRRDPVVASAMLVALTGYAQPEDRQRAREAGFDAHLAKPPDLTALRRLLAGRPAHDHRQAALGPPA